MKSYVPHSLLGLARQFLLHPASVRGISLSLVCAVLIWVVLTQPFVSAVPSQPPQIDTEKLHAHVRALSQNYFPRTFNHPAQLNAAADYIRQAFIATGLLVTEQQREINGHLYRNIIAHAGPDIGPLTIIGAHYDAHGDGDDDPDFPSPGVATPGADDNASGIAGLLELARLLKAHPPKQSVQLVAYTLEEPPTYNTAQMGSVWHANDLKASGRQVALMISLEMIGYFDDTPGSQTYPVPSLQWLYPDRGNFIAIIGRLNDIAATRQVKAAMQGATSLPVYSMNAHPALAGVDFSDHRSYWANGMRALMITDTAFNRNTQYHQAGDTHERLDYSRMGQVVQGVFALLHQ